MAYSETTATRKIARIPNRIKAVQGGCLARGTKIVMFDLSLKVVEDIVIGDKLMGATGEVRTVLKLYGGRSVMYKVHQAKGQDYIVNNDHLLVFEDQGRDNRATVGGKRIYTGRTHTEGLHIIRAEDFYNGSWKSTERRFKGIKASLDFGRQDVGLDPYFLGLWLGDGTSRTAAITNVDPEILTYLYEELPKLYDVQVGVHDAVTTKIIKTKGLTNEIIQLLKRYDLILNKHIPLEYIKNSREVRLQLLAGLLDSDGCLARDYKTKKPKGYYIVQKRKTLAEDIAKLARSLGYYTTFKERTSAMNREDGSVYNCQTYTVAIFAKDYTEIPVKVERKKCNMINPRNPLRSSVRLEQLPEDYYYGFELDGDHLFLLEDFTITHNTSASKTISIILVLIAKSQTDKKPKLTSIVSESIPHLKRGALRDFKNIMQEHNYWDDNRWSVQDLTYTFETGSKLEFFGVDSPDKLRGARRDRLFMNECNNNPFEAFNQLEVRTREEIYLDWNPTNEFWFYTDVLGNELMDVGHIIITYKDNEALEQSIIDSIETRKLNKGWWAVYGLGQLGEVEGKIYKDWKLDLEEVPHEARLEAYGLDFGFSNDPCAIVAIYAYNGGYILDEVLHRKGYHNSDIAKLMNNIPQALITADSAEPKSIEELQLLGLNVIGAVKGQGSVKRGIDYVQSQRISVTKQSVNIKKAYNNYLWKVDKDGKILNEPDHYLSDQMDAVRYGLESLRPREEETEYVPPATASLIY